jgi:hypothetical protein
MGMPAGTSSGQPGFPQCLLVSRQVFGTPIRAKNVLEIRNTQRWIETLQPDHRLMCFVGLPGHYITCGADTHAAWKSGLSCIAVAAHKRALSQPRRFSNLVRCARKPAVGFGMGVTVTA